ncbi:MAG: type II secretion system secretin GspD [Candidatus Brocadiia bacterium]
MNRALVGIVVLLVIFASPPSICAEMVQPPQGEQSPLVTLNLGDSVDVRVLAKWISEVTGQTFAYDESFQGTVMLETPRKLPESALLPLFESILQLKGYAMVRRGEVVMIVQTQAAAALEPDISLPSEELDGEGEFVNKMVQIEYADAAVIAEAIKPLMSSPNAVQVLAEQNKLSISGQAGNVQRALAVVEHLDQREARPRVLLRTLQYARAADVVAQLEVAFPKQATGPRAGLPVFNADRRTNSVVVVAAERDVDAVEETLQTLDVEAVQPQRPVRVYPLQNTKARHIVPLLEEIIQSVEGPTMPTGMTGQRKASAGTEQGGRPIKIVGDEENNVLIVVATRDGHEWLRPVIEDLDRRRPQVLIEAWLVALTESGARELGVELAARGSADDYSTLGTTFFGRSAVDEDTGVRGLPSPPQEGATIAVLRAGEVRAVLNALLQDEEARIVSRPRLLANANQEATFQSVQQEPFVTISAITSTTSTTAFGGFEQAGTALTITPTILEGDFVFLDVRLVVSNFTGTSPSAQVPPPRDENSVETSVTVPDRSTIVIGGIVRSEERETVKKVPLLGDIPLLGALFRSTSAETQDTVLYAFIRPEIFRAEDFADLQEASAREREDARWSTDVDFPEEQD